MKTFTLALLASLGLLSSVQAQSKMGVKGGLNASVLDGQQINQQTDYQYSYHAGIYYSYPLFGVLSIRPELLYSGQGSDFKASKEDYETKLRYLNLPLLLDLKLKRLHVLAGPQFGLLLTAKQVGTALVSYDPTTKMETYADVSRDVKSQYDNKDFGVCAGLELELGEMMRVGGRFNAGLLDVAKYKDVRSPNDPVLKSRVLQAYVAFQLGK